MLERKQITEQNTFMSLRRRRLINNETHEVTSEEWHDAAGNIWTKKEKKMAEKPVEQDLSDVIEGMGGCAYKFVSPGHRGVPDRILLRPIREQDRAIVARYIRFVECKDKDKEPEAHQEREHKRLRDLGFEVDVVDKKGYVWPS